MRSIYSILRFILTHPLARRNKTEALKRFFLYQVSKLFNPYPIVYALTDKTKLIVEKGMSGATGNIYCGLHEFEDMSFLLHFLRPEDLFVDVGANVGSYTMLASGHVGCLTKAFEPVPATYIRLRNNIAINYLQDRVLTYNIALGAEKNIIKFTSDLDTVNHAMLEGEHENYVQVNVKPLDKFKGDQVPGLIKIDVEGYEAEVLKGAGITLVDEALKAIIIELNGSGSKYGYNDSDIHQQLLHFGFLAYMYDPFTRSLIPRNSFGDMNTIYARDIEFVKQRLSKADSFCALSINV